MIRKIPQSPSRKISIPKLKDKMNALPKDCFGKYNLSVHAFSLEDM
ncbi:MAG: hypothetical protein ACI3YQ_02825 [Prevotella sp.]